MRGRWPGHSVISVRIDRVLLLPMPWFPPRMHAPRTSLKKTALSRRVRHRATRVRGCSRAALAPAARAAAT